MDKIELLGKLQVQSSTDYGSIDSLLFFFSEPPPLPSSFFFQSHDGLS